jgi:hypothetical protein
MTLKMAAQPPRCSADGGLVPGWLVGTKQPSPEVVPPPAHGDAAHLRRTFRRRGFGCRQARHRGFPTGVSAPVILASAGDEIQPAEERRG